MSATRDQSQKAAFVYSNLYAFYKKSKSAGLTGSGKVLRTSDARHSGRQFAERELQIKAFAPPELSGRRAVVQPDAPVAARPRAWAVPVTAPKSASKTSGGPVDDLKDNLRALGDLHSRMRFMLKELAVLLDDEEGEGER